jgi:hypothetical protein
MKKFGAQVADAVLNMKGQADQVVRGTTQSLVNAIILGTPVDTGRARGNWQSSIGVPKTGELARQDKSGGNAINEANSILAKWEPSSGQPFWLSNNLPYIRRLEYDAWSKQAPNGFLRINVEKWRAAIARKMGK